VGEASGCSEGLERVGGACVAGATRVKVPRGDSSWRPPDDQVGSAGEVAHTEDFALDRTEVTWARWGRCVRAGACAEVKAISGGDPGQAAHGMTLDEARAFCRFAGGRLPRDAEWLRAALGDVEKRYPWGDPDALCLRAAYGLSEGPCAYGATGPDTAGARPWGATPLGVLDLAGNVAEWVDDDAPAGMGVVRGGSFVESDASALRARWRRVIDANSRVSWVGLRCAYAPEQASGSDP
jgi:formylglycine-generating enzyme required for sulfatase activity